MQSKGNIWYMSNHDIAKFYMCYFFPYPALHVCPSNANFTNLVMAILILNIFSIFLMSHFCNYYYYNIIELSIELMSTSYFWPLHSSSSSSVSLESCVSVFDPRRPERNLAGPGTVLVLRTPGCVPVTAATVSLMKPCMVSPPLAPLGSGMDMRLERMSPFFWNSTKLVHENSCDATFVLCTVTCSKLMFDQTYTKVTKIHIRIVRNIRFRSRLFFRIQWAHRVKQLENKEEHFRKFKIYRYMTNDVGMTKF